MEEVSENNAKAQHSQLRHETLFDFGSRVVFHIDYLIESRYIWGLNEVTQYEMLDVIRHFVPLYHSLNIFVFPSYEVFLELCNWIYKH